MLARVYKYTPGQIADMTPAQQMMLLDTTGEHTNSVVRFNTYDEYMEWLSEQPSSD